MYIPKIKIEKNCVVCKNKFLTNHSNKKYCSQDCYRLFKRNFRAINRTKKTPNFSYKRWASLKGRAKKTNKLCCSWEDFDKFWNTCHICCYCKITETNWQKIFNNKTLSIDRKNNNKGYEITNIAWACERCNTLKGNVLTYDEMIDVGNRYIKPKWEILLNSIKELSNE